MNTGLKIAVYGALCLIWSSTWLAIKFGLEGAPPLTAAGYRFILSAIVILSIIVIGKISLPRTRRFYALSAYFSLFQIAIPYALVYSAEQHITSGLTSLLYSTMPFTVAILAWIILGDPLTFPKVAGIVIGMLGTTVIFWDSLRVGGPGAISGVCAALGGAACSSVSAVVAKRFSKAYHPIASIFLPMAFGGVLLTLGGLLLESSRPVHWNVATVGSIVYLAIFGSVLAFALYYWIMKHIDVTVLSYQSFIIPVLACLLGWIFLREAVTIKVAIGGGMILVGIALATFRLSRRKGSINVGLRQSHS